MIESYVKTKEGRESIIAYEQDEAPLPMFTFKSLQRNHKFIDYSTDFAVLDTETSHINENTAWIYQWAVKIKKTYIYGRTPDEFISLLQRMAERYSLNREKRLLFFVHNLPYDLQYLKWYLKGYDPKIEFFAINAHAVIICDVLGFRFLCSYKLTNLSLAALAKNYAKTYDKAVGEIDYNIVRYQDTELTEEDWFYMFSDVAAQMDGINGYLEAMGYKYAYKAPFTSTGFVRVVCRDASRKDPNWRQEFETAALDLEQYNLNRWAFMGGVCIASFKYAGKTVRGVDIGHDDITSSYPAQQTLRYFPTGAPTWYGDIDDKEEFEYLLETRCCVFELTLYDVHIKEGITAPCIPSSKCVGLKSPVRLNGKIVYAERLTIAVTEIDYKWIKRQYTASDMRVTRMLTFKRGAMPDWLKGVIFEFFKNKCTLKNAKDENGKMLYGKSKNFLNSIYGMTATAPLRPEYTIDADCILVKKEYEDQQETDAKQLKKYYRSYNSFMNYQYAVYTTAWARNELYEMIECVGYDNFLYCDTDSVFYIKTPENVAAMAAYREKCRNEAIKAGAYVDDKYLGEPTPEPPIRAFRALHAKCYAMEELNKSTGEYELQVVIAGIPKKSIKWIDGKPVTKTNAEELGNIDKLEDGFIFKHNGGTRCVYNEAPPEITDINGHITKLASSAVIDTIEKELSDTMWSVEGAKLLNFYMEQV